MSLGKMTPVRLRWSLAELLGSFRDIAAADTFTLRCKGEAEAHSKYIKNVGAERHFAEVAMQVSSAARLSVSFGHEWPPEIGATRASELDEALLQGIVGVLSSRCPLRVWACAIHTPFAACGEATPPLAAEMVARLATEELIGKADWSPEPEVEDGAA